MLDPGLLPVLGWILRGEGDGETAFVGGAQAPDDDLVVFSMSGIVLVFIPHNISLPAINLVGVDRCV
jgi:hypothetical protein